jgi:Rrf2 family protein
MTVASEYSCLALLAIAEADEGWCKLHEITTRFAIPAPFLQQILRKLTGAGFLVSRRGADGGFRLALEPEQLSIADVVRAVDGPLAPVRSASKNFYQPTPLEASPAFSALMREVRDAVAEILEAKSLADIVADEARQARRNAERETRNAKRGAATAKRTSRATTRKPK